MFNWRLSIAELQLTKLSRPAAKVIKRVAPGSAAAQQSQVEGAGGMQSMPTPQGSQPPSRSSPSLLPQRASAQNGPSEKRMPEHRNQVTFLLPFLHLLFKAVGKTDIPPTRVAFLQCLLARSVVKTCGDCPRD